MRRHAATVTWFFVAATAALIGCSMTTPQNGDVFDDPDLVDEPLRFQGYFSQPGLEITLEVLKDPTATPEQWTQFGSAITDTVPAGSDSAGNLLYEWSTEDVPLPAGSEERWPKGGVAQVRARHYTSGTGVIEIETFDAITGSDCIADNASQNFDDIAAACAGLGERRAALVQTTPLAKPAQGFLTKKGIGSAAETQLYYLLTVAPPNLATFKLQYGFGLFLPTEVNAKYYNDGDLGLGRDMHCNKLGTTVACYVTNYDNRSFLTSLDPIFINDYNPDFAGDPDNAIFKLENGVHDFATVAMVFTPPATAPNAVRFMVYGADGNLATAAKLDDAEDNTSIPQNCLSCHGINATYVPPIGVTGGQFLPFDPFSFKYSELPGVGLSQPEQEDEFRRLNDLVLKTSPTRAIQGLINGMYAPLPVSNPSAVSHDEFVPKGWKQANTLNDNPLDGVGLYRGVVKVGCRTCHVSASASALDFDEYDDFAGQATLIMTDACKSGVHSMPHAERVMKKFWESGARAYLVTGFPTALPLANGCAP